ncbi:cytidine deaminase [Candidatus Puniceispirillum sp.]|jgi:cytidine deaminase|uniref:cytidine deaminase n=1 Tax=Candidatus Puniceispirillum sp. TaxID=2026719 RepID=UPI001EBA7958|nr:cytidine deaminase [Candidatus Puniceispirillum sp.]MBT6565709.1 cytidine deaminase [Candidatus Puniceispirillum sp.]
MATHTPISDSTLIAAAIDAMTRAYAPYSDFAVGAALLDENGQIHCGANVENAAYPNGICAETSAIAMMVNAGGTHIERIAVAGGSEDGEILCTPCGGCRQRIREFAAPDTIIIIANPGGEQQRFTLADLLPHSFGPENLS